MYTIFFCWILILQGVFFQNLIIFLNKLDHFVTSSASSSGLLANGSKSRALWLVLVISPSSELGIAHHFFFFGFLALQGIFFQNLRIFLNWLDQFETSIASSSGLLAKDFVFGIFGALFLVGSSSGAPDGFIGWF